MALAPEEIDDATYMPASGFIYDLNFEVVEAIANASRGTHNLDMNAFIEAVAASDYSVANIRMRTLCQSADQNRQARYRNGFDDHRRRIH